MQPSSLISQCTFYILCYLVKVLKVEASQPPTGVVDLCQLSYFYLDVGTITESYGNEVVPGMAARREHPLSVILFASKYFQ